MTLSLIHSLLSLAVLLVTLSFVSPHTIFERIHGPISCGGPSNDKSPPPYHDCLLALEQVGVTAFSPFGEGGPPIDTAQSIAWYSPDSAAHLQSDIIPGTTVPKEWVYGRCRIAVDWQNGQVPLNPVGASLNLIRTVGTSVAKRCIQDNKRTNGNTEVLKYRNGNYPSGLSVSVNIYADHTDASFVHSLETIISSRSPLYQFLYSADHFLNYRGPSHFP